MSNNSPKTEEVKHHANFKIDIFNKYKQWYALPFLWKKMEESELKSKFGIDDEEILHLLSFRNQGEFAKAHNINEKTCSEWNKRMINEGNEYQEEINKWARKLSKNVVMSHYNKLIRKFDPQSAEIWYKKIDNWNEKKQLELSGKLSLLDLAKQVADEQGDNK